MKFFIHAPCQLQPDRVQFITLQVWLLPCYEGFSRLDSSEICINMHFQLLKGVKQENSQTSVSLLRQLQCPKQKIGNCIAFCNKQCKTCSLKFVELYYQQFEEDSVHSAVNNALTASWDIFVQLQEIASIIRLAHKENPCPVHCLFLDVMGQAKQLWILSVRQDDDRVNKDNTGWIRVLEEGTKEDIL